MNAVMIFGLVIGNTGPSVYDLLECEALLQMPIGTPVPEKFADLIPTLMDFAVEHEYIDPRERRHNFVFVNAFGHDLDWLRGRYQELRDAPRVNEASFFVQNRREINVLISFNRKYREHLEKRAEFELDRAAIITQVMDENYALYKVWDTLRDAKCEFYYVSVRRQALKKLKTILGDEAYYEGRMPDYVPIWRFIEL